MKHFFRIEEDGYFLKMFSLPHLLLLGVFALGVYLLYRNREKLKTEYPVVGKILGLLLLLDQTSFYIWQFASGYFNLRESLPLFHCRIVAWILVISLLFRYRPAQVMGIFWGLMGSVMALLSVDLYPFQFPHFTNFQFFHLHMMMGWSVAYLLFTKDYKITPGSFKKVVLFTSAYNIALYVFNTLMNRATGVDYNYGFLRHAPEGLIKYLTWVPTLLYPVLIILLFGLGLYLIYLLIKWVERKIA